MLKACSYLGHAFFVCKRESYFSEKGKKKVSWSNASSTLWITNYDVTESLTVTVIFLNDFSRHSS